MEQWCPIISIVSDVISPHKFYENGLRGGGGWKKEFEMTRNYHFNSSYISFPQGFFVMTLSRFCWRADVTLWVYSKMLLKMSGSPFFPIHPFFPFHFLNKDLFFHNIFSNVSPYFCVFSRFFCCCFPWDEAMATTLWRNLLRHNGIEDDYILRNFLRVHSTLEVRINKQTSHVSTLSLHLDRACRSNILILPECEQIINPKVELFK